MFINTSKKNFKNSNYTFSKENRISNKIWISKKMDGNLRPKYKKKNIAVFKLRESEKNSEKLIQIVGTRLEIWSRVLQTMK